MTVEQVSEEEIDYQQLFKLPENQSPVPDAPPKKIASRLPHKSTSRTKSQHCIGMMHALTGKIP
jgi:hypothetical protein